VDDVTEERVSRHCVVNYESKPYLGIILAVDVYDIEVKVMHSVGKNRFFCTMMDDVLWYKPDDVIGLLENPPHVTNRHMKLDDTSWDSGQQYCIPKLQHIAVEVVYNLFVAIQL